nr:hypothetical protein [Halorubrum salsamenti]
MTRSGPYTVVEPMNDHSVVTIREHPRNATYHVVEYDDEDTELVLDDLGRGDVVYLEIARVGRRGNAWSAEDARVVD